MTEKERTLSFLKGEPWDVPPKRTDVLTFGPGSPGFTYAIDLPICERPMDRSGYDVFGVHWTKSVEGCHWTNGQTTVLKDITNWRKEVRFPNVDRYDWDYVARQAGGVDTENVIVTATLIMGPFERFSSLCTFEDCLLATVVEPECSAELIGAIADYKISVIDRLVGTFKPDVVLVHDDWGTVRAPFLNPVAWREIIRPATQRIYNACKELGIVIAQHSCGNITPLVGDLVEMGLNIWEGQEYCNDVKWLKDTYGDRLHMLLYPKLDSKQMAELSKNIDYSGLRNARPYDAAPEFLYS